MSNEQMMRHIKSRILDIWNEYAFIQDAPINWLEDLNAILFDFFSVKIAYYYTFHIDTFFPVTSDEFATRNSIKWAEMEALFSSKNFVESPPNNSVRENGEVFILLKDSDHQVLGLLQMEHTDKWKTFSCTTEVDEFICVISKLVHMLKKTASLTQQEQQYRNLYNVTRMFHSTLDIGKILEGTTKAIQEAFPKFQSDLILSHDQDRKNLTPYKLFDYTSEREKTIEAYVSGEITSELAVDLEMYLLNVPLKGKQGIYGIMQISTPMEYRFSEKQKEFASLLASAAGNALENAKLYIQSHRLVSDLQLVNETSHKLNMNLSLDDMLLFLRKQLIKSFHPDQICFVFLNEENMLISSASSEFFHTLHGQLYIEHVAHHFKETADSLFIADFNRRTEKTNDYRSLIALPLMEQEYVKGFSIILHKEPYFFSFDSYKLIQSLIQHSSLAISNSNLRHQLQEMVNRDHLTNLFGRKYLDKFMEMSMENDDRGVFILMDIDNFKKVNDIYGHQVGDNILKSIASVIQKRTDGIGISARWGGEELAVYLPQMTLKEGVEQSNRILQLIPESTKPSVTVSIGVCLWERGDNITFQDLFHYADTALYEAKNNRKNQVRVFEASYL